MNNETYIDFCFIRKEQGGFSSEIDSVLKRLFEGKRLSWYLEEKKVDGGEMVVAEIKGMSTWKSEEEAVLFLEANADEEFWGYLQGYKMFIYPASTPGMHESRAQDKMSGRGCGSCGTH